MAIGSGGRQHRQRRWQCGQKYVERWAWTRRRIGVAQISQGSPSRP
jgi:hypothetical protein